MDEKQKPAVNWPRNALFVAGLGLVTAGAGFYSWPLALLVPGVVLVASAVWAQVRGR